MPWKATDAMKERTKFVLEWGPTGYAWINRYRDGDHDLAAVAESLTL